MNAINYIIAHFNDIVAILGGIIISARVIVKLTPTPKDDTVLDAVVQFLKHVGLNINPLLALCLIPLVLTSCGTTATGEKTFLGITSKQGLTIFGDAIKREAIPVSGAVLSARAANSAKNPTNVQP